MKAAYGKALLDKHGVYGLIRKYAEKKQDVIGQEYLEHSKRYLPQEPELAAQRKEAAEFSYRPLISILVPAYRTPEDYLRELLDSLMNQTYGKWQLCIADASGRDYSLVEQVVGEYQSFLEKEPSREGEILYLRLDQNKGISKNTNALFPLAKGEYIGLLDHDDLLTPNALFEVVRRLNGIVLDHYNRRLPVQEEKRPKLLYSDEDKIVDGTPFFPHFKPDYNEELLNHYNYICHFLVFRASLIDRVGLLNPDFDGAQDYDFVLRLTEEVAPERIAHISRILYHWRVSPQSTASFSGSKNYAYEKSRLAVEAHFKRLQEQRERLHLVDHQKPAHICDVKVEPVKGMEYVNPIRQSSPGQDRLMVCLAPGVSPSDRQWITRLAGQFYGHRGRIGMVGGKLVYGRGLGKKVLCSGLSYASDGTVFPVYQGLPAWLRGYFQRAAIPHNVSGLSLDFCLIDPRAYQAVGGFAESLPQPYRDMDFAFRLREAGYEIILDPSVTAHVRDARVWQDTGAETIENAREWEEILLENWQDIMERGDPYYNANIGSNGHL